MPRKPKKVVRTEVTEEEIEQAPALEPDEIVSPAEEALSRVVRRYGEDGLSMRVSKMSPAGWMFLGALSNPDDADEEALQRRYPAGGEFKIDVLVNGEPRYQRKVLIAPLPGAEGMPVGGGSRTDALLERVLDRLANPPQVQQQSSALELAQAVAAVRETAPAPPDPMAALNMVTQVVALVKGLMPSGETAERPWYRELIDEVKPFAGPIVAGFLKANNGNGAGPSLPAPQPNGHAMEQPTPENVTEEQLRAILGGLKQFRHMDPDWVLEYIEGHLHDPLVARVVGLVRSQNFEFFAQFDPEITGPAFGEWFRAIYNGLRSDLPGPDSVDTDPGGKGGNGGNAPAHAKPRGKRGEGGSKV